MIPLFKKILKTSDNSNNLEFYTINIVESTIDFIDQINVSLNFTIKALISITINCKTQTFIIDVENPPSILENGLIYDFIVESNKIKSFKFKPKKDGVYEIRYIEFLNFIGDSTALEIFVQNNNTGFALLPDNKTDAIYSITMDNDDLHIFVKKDVESALEGNPKSYNEYSSTCISINPQNIQNFLEPLFSKSINCLNKLKFDNKLLLKTALQSKIIIKSKKIENKLINKLYNLFKDFEKILHDLKCKFSDLIYKKSIQEKYALKECSDKEEDVDKLKYFINILTEKIKLLKYNFKKPLLVDINYFGRLNKLSMDYFFEKENFLTKCDKKLLEKII